MTNEAQINANRENGKLGGVKTEEGKAVSRYNAIKHGILCQDILIKGENEDELIELGKKMRSELTPETEIELLLVDRIVANAWRLKRALKGEKEMIECQMKDDDSFSLSPSKNDFGTSLVRDFVNHETHNKFARYETSIEKGIYKALHELQRLQAARQGEKVPPPIAIDVDINGEK
jgi:hypothetical protein